MGELILLWFFAAAVCVVLFGGWLPGQLARRRGNPNASAISLCGWIGLLLWPLWLVALIWAHIGHDIRNTEKAEPVTDGPGKFKVVGVDVQTGYDTELVVEADSAANASVKGELKGVRVTEIIQLPQGGTQNVSVPR